MLEFVQSVCPNAGATNSMIWKCVFEYSGGISLGPARVWWRMRLRRPPLSTVGVAVGDRGRHRDRKTSHSSGQPERREIGRTAPPHGRQVRPDVFEVVSGGGLSPEISRSRPTIGPTRLSSQFACEVGEPHEFRNACTRSHQAPWGRPEVGLGPARDRLLVAAASLQGRSEANPGSIPGVDSTTDQACAHASLNFPISACHT